MKNQCRTRMIAITPQYSKAKAKLIHALNQTYTVHKLKLYRLRDSEFRKNGVVLDAFMIIEPLLFSTTIHIKTNCLYIGKATRCVINAHLWEKPPGCTHNQSLRLFNGMIKRVELKAENYINYKEKKT